jgi:hypothetical protein
MKLSKNKIQRIIKEELARVIRESHGALQVGDVVRVVPDYQAAATVRVTRLIPGTSPSSPDDLQQLSGARFEAVVLRTGGPDDWGDFDAGETYEWDMNDIVPGDWEERHFAEALDPNVHSGRPQSTEIYPVDQQQDFEDELWMDDARREEAWQQQQQETGEVPPGAWSGDSDEDDEYDDDDYEELPKNRSMRKTETLKIKLSELRQIVREIAVGVGSSQGQMGIKSAKKNEDCDADGKKAFSHEILVSGDENLEES